MIESIENTIENIHWIEKDWSSKNQSIQFNNFVSSAWKWIALFKFMENYADDVSKHFQVNINDGKYLHEQWKIQKFWNA